MKIKLIGPKAEAGFNHFNFYRYKGQAFFASPGGLATVAALTPKDVHVGIIDENVEKIDFDDHVDIVGISITSSFLAPRAYKISRDYKRKGVPVIFGGLHTSLFPKECLEYADAIVVGEAEDVWEDVITDFKKGKLKKVYKCEKRPALDKRPMPRWDLLKLDSYDVITINATRGCPYNCKFCLVKLHMGNKLRHKPIEDVIKEVEYVKNNFRRKNIWFIDPNFTADREYAKKLATALIPVGIKYYCFANIDIYKDKEILELLAKSGCYALSVGIESLDSRNISAVRKEKTNKIREYAKAIEGIRKHGIELIFNFMIGNTFDDEKTFENLENFIEENNILFPCIFPAGVFPCTQWYVEINNDTSAKLNEFNFFNYAILNPNKVDKVKFWVEYTKLFFRVYSYKSTFKRKIRLIKKSKGQRYNLHNNVKSFLRLLKRVPRAIKTTIETRSGWAGCIELFYSSVVPFLAWQQISCSKNFLIAYCNLNLERYSKMPSLSLKEDLLLKTVKKLVKKEAEEAYTER